MQNKIFCWSNEENFFIKNPILSRKNLIYFRFFLFYEEGRRFNTNWIKHKVLALLSHNWFHCFVFLKLCSSMIPLCVNKGKHACVLRLKSDRLQTATAVCLVESRVLYVGAKESLRNISRSGEKGGPACGWWKVESSMLGYRKACCCSGLIVTRQSAFLPLSSFNTDLDTKCPLLAKGKNAKAD